MNETKKKNTIELKKHVATIHAGGELNLVQRKIANALLHNAYSELLTKEEHSIHVDELSDLIGYNSKDSKLVKKSLVALLSSVIEWNLLDDKSTNKEAIWNASSIISDASIKGPICTYSYSRKMRELLHHPEVYARINIAVTAKFKSTYGLALYENCVRYQNIKQTPWISLEKFRKLMGVSPSKYKRFTDFKKRVIDAAVQEVNGITDLSVSFDVKKRGKDNIELKFSMHQELCQDDDEQEMVVQEQQLLAQVLSKDFGLSQKQIKSLLSQYQIETVNEKISLIYESSSYRDGQIKNMARYLISALEEDYIKPVKARPQANIAVRVEQQSDKLLRQEYNTYRRQELLDNYQKQTDKQRSALILLFEEHLENTLYNELYIRDGMSNPIIIDELMKFVRINQHPIYQSIINFEDYCAQRKATGNEKQTQEKV